MKILLLEDDELFASSLIDFLEEEKYSITHVSNSNTFLDITYKNKFDIYLLDINVPDISGVKLLKMLRGSNDTTPSIFLTSYNDKQTLKDAFKSGADDFLVKPFDTDELLLRINALLKRSGKIMKNIKINEIIYDVNLKSFIKNGLTIKVTKKVIDLFELFLYNQNKIISKELIIDKLWTSNENYSDGSIRVYIAKLKDIFGKDIIINIRGQGYQAKFK